ncbi:hypothetical protein ARMGADRAFT_1144090 [Armillaria gallica]|uniref:C2H2-type domain-containing protein n=1 Tax=Armillaria gallica TaxID=47427 RepID=A0A2H3CI41_ARMGA|nr:hypothetical protein ARMGADRAFT_1144090 [Armillaria gallica]
MWICTFGCKKQFQTRDAQQRHLGVHNEDMSIVYQLLGRAYTLPSTSGGYPCPTDGCHFRGVGILLDEHLGNCIINRFLAENPKRRAKLHTPGTSRTNPFLRKQQAKLDTPGTSGATTKHPLADVSQSDEPASKRARGSGDEKHDSVDDIPSDFDDVVVNSDPCWPARTRSLGASASSSPPSFHTTDDLKLAPSSSPPSPPADVDTAPLPTPSKPSPSPVDPGRYPTPLWNVQDLTKGFELKMLQFTADKVVGVADSCVYHTMMNQELNTDHSSLWNGCSSGMRSGSNSSHYEVFRVGFFFKSGCCYLCGTPHWHGFKHRRAKKCDDDKLADWLKGLAYIIWRTKALRQLIFPALGLDVDEFPASYSYKLWLSDQPTTKLTLTSNLVLVAYAYFKADEVGVLPKDELEFDDVEPPH